MRQQPFEMFKVLGVSTRVKMLELLKTKGPLPVKTIAQTLGISAAAVSQHLKTLRQAGLVTSERKGYWVPYSVDVKSLDECCGSLIKVCSPGLRPSEMCCGVGLPEITLASLRKRREELKRELENIDRRIAMIRKKG